VRARELGAKDSGAAGTTIQFGVPHPWSHLVQNVEFTHTHRVQEWLILDAASVSYGKATTYLPVIDLIQTISEGGVSGDL
jgi:hypothetical protein